MTSLPDFYVIKYDKSGNILWARSGGGTGYDYPAGVAVDGNGNVYVAGHFDSPTIYNGAVSIANSYTAGGYYY